MTTLEELNAELVKALRATAVRGAGQHLCWCRYIPEATGGFDHTDVCKQAREVLSRAEDSK